MSLPSHPVNRPVLAPLMLVFLVAGGALVMTHDTELELPLFDALAVVSFACFALLFGLFWLGWLLREHELWREQRCQDAA
jgi:hypothetical protein